MGGLVHRFDFTPFYLKQSPEGNPLKEIKAHFSAKFLESALFFLFYKYYCFEIKF
jgi:hypothetical protein